MYFISSKNETVTKRIDIEYEIDKNLSIVDADSKAYIVCENEKEKKLLNTLFSYNTETYKGHEIRMSRS